VNQDQVILKLGGSVITHKDRDRLEVKQQELERICQEICQAMESREELSLILVHGAGPFGHQKVAQYGINNGLQRRSDVEGFVRTHNSMEDLNYQVMCTMRDQGLWGYPVTPGAIVLHDHKEIVEFWTANIRRLQALDRRVIPVLYGDMVPDRQLRGSVVSGDAIVVRLALDLGAKRVCLGTDVDGIYDRDPKEDPTAHLYKLLQPEELERVMGEVGGAMTTDVTGGMKKKLHEIKENLAALGQSGVRTVSIFNATTPGNVRDVLMGAGAGTTIEV